MKSLREFRMDAPVTVEQYKVIDEAVHIAARQAMIGRRLMPTFGPLGFGKQALAYDSLTEVSDAEVNLAWRKSFSEDIVNLSRETIPIPVLSKAFRINRRSLAASQTAGTALDVASAKSAAYKVAKAEDTLILLGYSADGTTYDINGLYKAAGNTEAGSTWGTATNIPIDINDTIAELLTDNIFPPYNLVLHPDQYMETSVLIGSTGVSYREWIERILGGTVFVTPAQTAGTGMMLAAGDRGFFDLAVGTDVTTEVEVLGLDQGRDLFGVVYECVVPRIMEANAICTMTGI